ncbi:glycosyl hydrolase family 61 [Colletotrichum higginsianum]|uniref:lytic cellulose monooxygenase (C4-dehydrogenating) n=1 Tax=Colletotrichum higginsianum TaxID=80884 RepID=A0A4T0VJZ8_9PEZI|nr:Polysaccharide monooxygenase Cel61a [Colletotrichum higginsianum]GJC98494.1 glycosyl hydrolase family 61 [Colletotrichum higginsianum]
MIVWKYAFLASAALRTVDAHGTVNGIMADGVFYEGYSPQMQFKQPPPQVVGWSIPQDLSNGFVAVDKYADPDIICHVGAEPAPIAAKVTAGSNLTVFWTADWPESHHGPMMDYLAPCNGDCAGVNKADLQFFKIDAVGLVDGTKAPGRWGSDDMLANNRSWTMTIPAGIAAGQYVLRHETIALHEAGREGGAQNYPQCVNIDVQGGGSEKPPGVRATELYRANDEGIKFNIYKDNLEYSVPGPPVLGGQPQQQPQPQPPQNPTRRRRRVAVVY